MIRRRRPESLSFVGFRLRTDRMASTVIRGHAFIQNLRRGHNEMGVGARHERLRIAAAFDELATAI